MGWLGHPAAMGHHHVTWGSSPPAASGDILLLALMMPWVTVSPGARQGVAEGAWAGLDLVAPAQSSLA